MQVRIFIFLVIMALLSSHQSEAQIITLSNKAQISLITGSPGQDVYNIFGHSGLRVYDPSIGLDIMYSYGTFDFDTPNFLLKFAQGKLNYSISVAQYPPFIAFYQREGRTVYEQVLDLTFEEKNAVFAFLQNNFKPENRYYLYDFFYDNCSTRIRDALKKIFKDNIKYNEDQLAQNKSFRACVDPYVNKPWVRFGIYLLLGAPADKIADGYNTMFLPDNLMEGFSKAQIKRNGQWIALAPESKIVSQSLISAPPFMWLNPYSVMWGLSAVLILITFLGYRKQKISYALDFGLFFLMGLVGLLFLFMWFGTNHQTCAWNFNLLWALPTHAFAAWGLLFGREKPWLKTYFKVTAGIQAVLLLAWVFLPQDMHGALPPWVLMLGLRAARIAYN